MLETHQREIHDALASMEAEANRLYQARAHVSACPLPVHAHSIACMLLTFHPKASYWVLLRHLGCFGAGLGCLHVRLRWTTATQARVAGATMQLHGRAGIMACHWLMLCRMQTCTCMQLV